MKTLSDRFWDRVHVKKDGCWEWLGTHDPRNYGLFRIGSSITMAHRYAYELLIGVIPGDKEIDHLCRNHNCVNPEHLEPVTHTVNVRRGLNGTNHFNLLKTKCPHGHPYNKSNTYIYRQTRGGLGRQCRACENKKRRRENNPSPYPVRWV